MTESVPEDLTDPSQHDLLDTAISQLAAGEEEPLRLLLQECHPAEIAGLLESLPGERRRQLWALVPGEAGGEVLAYLREEARASILDEMDHSAVVAATESMAVEDLAHVVEELPEDVGEAVLRSLDEDRRQRLETTLGFAEETAGRLMSADVISVRKTVTLAVVLRYLRRLKVLPAHTDCLMVTDEDGIYLGKLSIADAVTGNPDTTVADAMQSLADWVRADAGEHDVAVLFERRDLTSVAVVDELGRLLGRITIDDAMSIIRAEADRAVLARAGLHEDEDLFAPVLPSARRRAVWLGINLATVFLAAWVIGRFEEALDKIVALAVLMPVVASMGGIAGSQTLTLTIRGLAVGQVGSANLKWLANKELAVGMLNGLTWATVVALVTLAWFGSTGIAVVIGIAMVINLLAAAASGVIIPIVLKRMGADPALFGAVVLTTVTDVVGFLSFLGLATLLLL